MSPKAVRPLRILHVIATLDPATGGPPESVRMLMSYAQTGYVGEVVTLDAPDAPFLQNLPFPVHALGPVSMRYAFSIKLYRWLSANAHRFDGVVVNGLWNFCGLATYLALRGKTPYMVFSHGMLDPYFKQAFPLKHMKKWAYWIVAQHWVLRGAYRVLFTTKQESELAERSFWLHEWDGHVVPYGCNRPDGDREEQIEAFYKRLPEIRGKRYVVFLGRIHKKKGCDLLLEAFRKVAAQDPELHLVMAGPDPQAWSADLKEVVDKAGLSARVHWPGMLTGDDKWGLLYASEVFVLPSHQENFGIAVAEALACGIPVLISDKVNIAPDVAQDGAGLLETDTQAGTDALLARWIAMPAEQRKRMAQQALITHRERYNMEENAASIIRLFRLARTEHSNPATVPVRSKQWAKDRAVLESSRNAIPDTSQNSEANAA